MAGTDETGLPLDFNAIATDLIQRAAHLNQTIMSGEGQLLLGIAQLVRVLGSSAEATERYNRRLVILTVVLILLGIVQLVVAFVA